MEEDTESNSGAHGSPPLVNEAEQQATDNIIKHVSDHPDVPCEHGKDESRIGSDSVQEETTIASVAAEVRKLDSFISSESGEPNEDLRSLGDLDGLGGAAGSDSGVEGCGGRALSSGGGSQSCASSVVSCGSGCSDSSSLAPPHPRRRVNLTEPQRPLGTSTPRPVTAPRGPNLATRERARSREKPTLPEKPRPLTPKPRIRPNADLPNIVRESPALRAKPTKTSAARCRTPVSPGEEKRWPTIGTRMSTAASDASATRVAADKYGTLPRRRREADVDSPKHESATSSRRPTITRSASSRATRAKVRIYAEKTTQTVLLGSDVEAALGGVVPNIERISEVTRSHRGVQASSRDDELSLATTRARQAEGLAESERERRLNAEALLEAEREASRAAHTELHNNSMRLLELAGTADASSGADGCLRALEDQLRASAELATQQQQEIERLREQLTAAQAEASDGRAQSRTLEARLVEVERDSAEMQDFLAAETSALGDSLRETETELLKTNQELERRRVECRQLVRLCEQRRQEALVMAARARGNHALTGVARRLRALTAVLRAEKANHSRSDSEAATPEDGLGVPSFLSRNNHRPAADDRSRHSDDNSADLLDSETEPCLVMDPEFPEEPWSESAEVGEGAEGWSGSEVSGAEEASLRSLSAAIVLRHRAEDEDPEQDTQRDIDNSLTELMRALRLVSEDDSRLAHSMRDRVEASDRTAADAVAKRLEDSKHDHYRHSVETIKMQSDADDEFGFEEDAITWSECDRRLRYEALDAALSALVPRVVAGWPALAAHRDALERMALVLATPPKAHA